MGDKTDHECCVVILNVTYLIITRLQASYYWLSAIILNDFLRQEYPNMWYCARWSWMGSRKFCRLCGDYLK